MTVTLKDIADKSGVSIGTVDRALKNNGRIAKETQNRILKIAHEMNYIPNRAAQALVKQQPLFTLGFLFNGMHNRFYDRLMTGIQKIQQIYTTSELSLHLKPIQDFSADAQLAAIDELINDGIDGLIIVPIPHVDIIQRLRYLIADNFPLVVIDEPSNEITPLSFIYGNFLTTFVKMTRLAELIGHPTSHITILDQSYLRSTNFSFFERFYEAVGKMKTTQLYTLLPISSSNPSDYLTLTDNLRQNSKSDIIICGGSPEIISSLIPYKSTVNPDLKVIALDYEYTLEQNALNQLVSFSLNQNTDQFSTRAIQFLFDYLSNRVQATAEIITIDSQISICEFD